METKETKDLPPWDELIEALLVDTIRGNVTIPREFFIEQKKAEECWELLRECHQKKMDIHDLLQVICENFGWTIKESMFATGICFAANMYLIAHPEVGPEEYERVIMETFTDPARAAKIKKLAGLS